jgi:hypothetical protein
MTEPTRESNSRHSSWDRSICVWCALPSSAPMARRPACARAPAAFRPGPPTSPQTQGPGTQAGVAPSAAVPHSATGVRTVQPLFSLDRVSTVYGTHAERRELIGKPVCAAAGALLATHSKPAAHDGLRHWASRGNLFFDPAGGCTRCCGNALCISGAFHPRWCVLRRGCACSNTMW